VTFDHQVSFLHLPRYCFYSSFFVHYCPFLLLLSSVPRGRGSPSSLCTLLLASVFSLQSPRPPFGSTRPRLRLLASPIAPRATASPANQTYLSPIMALLSAEHLAGPGYIILNTMRGLNIIALASVVASSIVMLVKTFIVSKVLFKATISSPKANLLQFFFFDATSHVITAIAGLFLIVSECSLFHNFFARNWPLLSPAHGFVTLGCAMMVIGLNMLGNMNKQATSQQSLGLPFWRLLLASGILAIVIGFFNVVSVRKNSFVPQRLID